MLKVFVPSDTTADALGADDLAGAVVATAAAHGQPIELVRNGSRGMFWLEPLLEVEDSRGRRAYGPVTTADINELFASGFPEAGSHPLALGNIEEHPWLAGQHRVTFARAGLGDPLSLNDYRSLGGLHGLQRAIAMTPQEIIEEIRESGLRGRGGAAFPTAIKWQTVLDTPSDQKYICCNADEGDSGTFADRLLMEADPFQLIEGMIVAGLAVGATRGYIYLRSEYPRTKQVLDTALALARDAGILGNAVMGSDRVFDITLRLGANAYICGEETSMLESLEGKRGLVRSKPPLPAIEGLFGKPTVVNNVLTLGAASSILAEGGAAYQQHGMERSRGTLTAQLAGNIKRGGLVEIPYGATLREVLFDFGGGSASGRPLRAVQVGGPLGTYLPESLWDTPLDYESFSAAGGMLGHGGIVAFDDTVDLSAMARFAMEFCAIESCGKCTPCRVGSVRGIEIIDQIRADQNRNTNFALLDELCDTMEDGSLCAMGGMTPYPVRSALKHFPEDFRR